MEPKDYHGCFLSSSKPVSDSLRRVEEEEGGGVEGAERRGVKLKASGNGEAHLAESRTARGD